MVNTPNHGYLTVSVTTASDAIPLPGVVITVSQTENGRDVTLAVLQTDRDGRTEKIMLPAPPQSNSLTPTPNGPAYSLYNIQAEKEGYYSSNSLNVPVFPDVTSIQPVRLIPLPAGYGKQGDGIRPQVAEGIGFGLSENESASEVR